MKATLEQTIVVVACRESHANQFTISNKRADRINEMKSMERVSYPPCRPESGMS
jgi:hypothetical protein